MRFSVTVGVALALALAAPPAHALPARPESGPLHCPELDPPPGGEERERYLCGDPRLGPAELPEEGPVARLLEGYDRFGGLTPVEFLDRWAAPEGWDYPDHMGFVVEDGEPVTEKRTLLAGERLDRFGSPRGSFLAPAGAPYARRALPPDSLNTWPGGPEHNYNCYAVAAAVPRTAKPRAGPPARTLPGSVPAGGHGPGRSE
ncbi:MULTISPECIES: TNT domain-containing protein [unclassified Nocardiopsis]|uniref:TNT domain-containing protein n=1 Tax=unclassified Nocardiopsis TaxID=2649073 RepID=UPI001357098D|nr:MULTISPECIES: TNT domain-containing protein [unclassified Nocardiopsis]